MKLIIEDDEGRKTVVPIVREDVEITIGRQEGNTIRLTERNISRKHAKLIRRNGVVCVEDLGSYNGVKINGDRISGTSEIKEGDLVQIGDYDLAIQTEEGLRPEAKPDSGAEDASGEGSDPGGDAPAEAEADDVEPAGAPAPASSRRESTAIISNAQLKATRSRKVADIAAEEAPRLLVLAGEFAGREYACIRTEIKIGRTEDNDIAIDHRSLSRNHCKVVREDDGEWKVIDLQSSNGVKVNGEQYAASALHTGDVLELGHIKFKFLAPGDDAGEASTLVGRSGGRSRLPLIAGAVVGLAALGAGGYLLTREKPVAVVKTPTDPVAPKAPDKPETVVQAPPTMPDPQVAVDPPKQPDPPATPDLPPPDPQAVKAMEAGRQLLAAGKFAEAEKKLAAAKDADVEGAAELLAQARAELEAQEHVAAAQKKLAAKDLDGARLEATAVPPDSALSAKARAVEAQIDAAQEKLDRERQATDARTKAEEEKRAKAEQAKLAAEQARQAAEQAKAEQAKQAKAAADQAKAAAEQAKANAGNQAKTSTASASESPAQQAAADLATGKSLASNSQKKYKEAIPYLERALKADPGLAEAHLYLGTCYARLEDTKRGAYHYEEFVHLRPNDSQAPKVRAILREYFRQSGERPRWPLPEE